MARKDRMYGKSPSLKRGESGEVEVEHHVKKEHEAGADGAIREGESKEAMPAHVRHAQERRHMHERHETEHALHDYAHEGEDKHEMHGRHEKEIADMHKRHEKELKSGTMEPEGKKRAEVKKEDKGGETKPTEGKKE